MEATGCFGCNERNWTHFAVVPLQRIRFIAMQGKDPSRAGVMSGHRRYYANGECRDFNHHSSISYLTDKHCEPSLLDMFDVDQEPSIELQHAHEMIWSVVVGAWVALKSNKLLKPFANMFRSIFFPC